MARPHLERFELDTATGARDARADIRRVVRAAGDHYGRNNQRPYRYTWGPASMAPPDWVDEIVMIATSMSARRRDGASRAATPASRVRRSARHASRERGGAPVGRLRRTSAERRLCWCWTPKRERGGQSRGATPHPLRVPRTVHTLLTRARRRPDAHGLAQSSYQSRRGARERIRPRAGGRAPNSWANAGCERGDGKIRRY